MTPGEVASLQALAQQHGGSLTTNPHTGLPEAGFLSALLPIAAGAGLAAMGVPAGYAALAVGATSAATNGGDLKKGMMAGISAYGGAGMAGAFMNAGVAAPATVLETPAGATSPYALTGASAATPSTAGSSLGSLSSFTNKPEYLSLASAAPAEAAQAAAAATPAAQAAQQAAALDSMSMGQRFDALKAGASGTNAINYIKANPLTSLGVGLAAIAPDENKTPQKAADTDRGPRAGLSYYPGWSNPLPKPNMQGVEQTYNRPYYAAEGGVTRMATGGITSAPRNQQQLFAEYLQRVANSGAAATSPTNKYEWWKSGGNSYAPATPPAETPEEYAARMRANARGGDGGGGGGNREPEDPNSFSARWAGMSDAEKEAWRLENPNTALAQDALGLITSPLKFAYDKFQEFMGPDVSNPKSVGMVGLPSGYNPETPAAYPSGNFADAPLSSRTDVSGYPLRGSELRSLESGLAPASGQVKGDPFAGFFSSDPTLNQVGKYADPSTQPAGFFPAGTAYTDKAFFRDRYGNLFAPGDSIPAGTTAGGNMALADQNKLQGLAQQRAIEANKPVDPFAQIEAEDAAERATKAQIAAAEQKQFEKATLQRELQKSVNLVNADPSVVEGDSGLALSDKISSLQNQINKLDSPYSDRFVQENPLGMYTAEDNANAINNLERGDRFAPVNFSNQFLSPEAYQAEVNKANEALTPYSAADEADRMFAAPDIVGINEIKAEADTDIGKKPETLGIPSAETFAAMIGPSLGEYAALNNGIVSDAGIQGGYNPAFGAPATGGHGLAGVSASFGGLGSAWRNVTDQFGGPVLTSQGRAENAFNASPEGIAAENTREIQSLLSRYPAPVTEAEPPAPSADEGPQGSPDTSGDNPLGDKGEQGEGYNGIAHGGMISERMARGGNVRGNLRPPQPFFQSGKYSFHPPQMYADGGVSDPYNLGSYSDGGRLLKGPGDGVSDSIPATIGKGRPARLADGEFVIPARIVSEIGNGSTEAGARKLYAMMDRIQAGRKKSVGKGKVAVNSRADKYLPA